MLVGVAICSFIMHLAYPPPKNLSDPIFNKRASLDERTNLNDEDQVVVDALAAAGCWGEYLCSNGEFVRVEHFVKPSNLKINEVLTEQVIQDLINYFDDEPNKKPSSDSLNGEMSISKSDMERLRKDLHQAKVEMFETKSKFYQSEMYKRPGGYEQVWGL